MYIYNRGEFSVESKETKQRFALVVEEEVTPPAEISEKMKLLLEEFKEVVHDELPKGLPPHERYPASYFRSKST